MKWTVLESLEVLKLGFFRLRKDKCRLPDGRVMPQYYTLEFADWVNVIPMTPEGKIVLIRQYRHSIGEVVIEVPGGSTDPRTSESAQTAALRELEEETGYVAKEIQLLGSHFPNPALLSNRMHTYVAHGCVKAKPQNLDPFEDIEVFEVSKHELQSLIQQGKIKHSLILASLLLASAEWNTP